MAASRRALLTFAFVSEGLKTHQDILVALAPLFHPIAADLSGKLFSAQELKQELATRYGLSITSDVAEFISFSLHKVGLLKRKEVGAADVAFFWTAPLHPIQNAPSEFETKIDRLATVALRFANENPSLLNWKLDASTALDMLFDWILDQDKELHDAELIFSKKENETVALQEKRLRTEQDYFCSRFILWLRRDNSDLYEFVSELGNSILISEVVMELRSPSVTPDRKGSLYIYLDAPFCMELIGCSGRARKEEAAYLIERLRSFGAIICVFSHSIDEITSNLKAVLSNNPSERTGPTAAAMLANEVPEEFLVSVLRNPEEHLDSQKISEYDIKRSPLPPATEQVFPDQYQTDLFGRLQQFYSRLEAAERDALSATIVMRRRARQHSTDFFRCKHVMITRNPMVAAVAKKYCCDAGLLSEEHVGPFILARRAAAIIWLAVGSQQKAEISRRQLVLSCSKALESAPDVIHNFRRRLKEIQPENIDAFDTLITEPRNLQIAMDFVQGSESRALESDPGALLEKMTAALTQEERKKHAEQTAKLKEAHREQLAKSQQTEQSLRNEVDTLKAEIISRRQKELEIAKSLFDRFARRCRKTVFICRIIFALLIFSVVFVTSSILLERIDKAWVHGWTLGLSFMAAILLAAPVFFDPVKVIEKMTRIFFRNWFQNEIRRNNLEEIVKQADVDWSEYTFFERVTKRGDTLI